MGKLIKNGGLASNTKQQSIKNFDLHKSFMSHSILKMNNMPKITSRSQKQILPNKYSDELIPVDIFKNLKEVGPENLQIACKKVIINDIEKSFKKFEEANNGVISTSKISMRGGGDDLYNLLFTQPELKREFVAYCGSVSNDMKDIESYINKNNGYESGKLNSTNMLKRVIDSGTSHNITININSNKKYDYARCRKIDSPNFKTEYSYFDYNKYIVTAYEQLFLGNDVNMNKFIKRQMEYIDNLTLTEKRIIQDYTKNATSFNFYLKWIRDEIDWENPETFKFGDSFYPQIYKLLIFKYGFEPYRIEYSGWLNSDRLDQDSTSIFRGRLEPADWISVLEEFKIDLNNIIAKAPKTTDYIYCYRGVNRHYILDGEQSIIHLGDGKRVCSYINKRFSSFTLDFKIAHKYHKDPPTGTNCIYKILVSPNCKILFLPPLSLYPDEIEFLVPPDSIYLYNLDSSNNELTPYTATNNLYNKYGICSFKNNGYIYNEFKSFDVVLEYTPCVPMRSNYAPLEPSTTTSTGILTEKDMLEQYDISLVKSIINRVGSKFSASSTTDSAASGTKFSPFTFAKALLKLRNSISSD